MLKVSNLVFLRDNLILDKISFSLKKGQLISIVGKSGVGKSTLLSCLSGLLPINSGKIVLNNIEQKYYDNSLLPGFNEIVLMNQNFSLDLYHRVDENIKNACLNLKNEILIEWVDELLALFELEELRYKNAINLSGGEQQRLAFAVALAKEPAVLLLDEPFSNLDVHIKDKVINFILLLKKRQKTGIIIVTHNGSEALQISDEIIFINNGKIQRKATPYEFYYKPNNLYEANFFGKINYIKISGNEFIFRPNQYELFENDNNYKIEIKFIKKHFFGIISLFEYSYKKYKIFLYQHNDEILHTIYLKNNL